MKHKIIVVLLIYSINAHAAECMDMVSQAMKSWCQDKLPQDFGKTHFILGFPHEELDELRQSKPTKKAARAAHACKQSVGKKAFLFSPDDDLAAELIDLINQEKNSIKVAIFTFTHDDIAQALIAAHARGVKVEIVTDAGYKADRYSKIHGMQEHGIRVFEYDPEYIRDRRSNIMHHKFVVFGLPNSDESYVWMGSFNFTKAADDRNQESVVILCGAQAATSFNEQFERIKQQRCVGCKTKTHQIAYGSPKSNKQSARHSYRPNKQKHLIV